MHILVIPSGFKEGLSSESVALAMARGARCAVPAANIVMLPLFDGGEGFTRALVSITGGTLHATPTCDPFGRPIDAKIGLLGGNGDKTAVIDIASAAGLRLMAPAERDLARASSAGVGHLMRHALDLGARRLLIGCGDSGINDGGSGLARILGFRFLGKDGRDLPDVATALTELVAIDCSGLDPRLASCRIEAVVNAQNMLTGPGGVSRVYGPQKGAPTVLVGQLDAALATLGQRICETTGRDVVNMPGAGASGGIGATLAGLLGAQLIPHFDLACTYLPIDEKLAWADLVLTAEGQIDAQSAMGKSSGEIAARAQGRGRPVIMITGSIGDGADTMLTTGADAYFSIVSRPMTLADAMRDAETLIEAATAHAVRAFHAGYVAGARLARPLRSGEAGDHFDAKVAGRIARGSPRG